MTWVNDTLPPRARDRWLLMTIRLSISSFTGTDRTLVAVGTVRLTSMFCTVRAEAPRSGTSSGSSLASPAVAGPASLGNGDEVGAALVDFGASGLGCTSVAGVVLVTCCLAGVGDCG